MIQYVKNIKRNLRFFPEVFAKKTQVKKILKLKRHSVKNYAKNRKKKVKQKI